MNDELKEKLLHYIGVLEEGASKSGEFIAEQAPETVRQWIAFNIIENAIVMALFFSVTAFTYRGGRRLWEKAVAKRAKEYGRDDGFAEASISFVLMVVSGISFIGGCVSIHYVLLPWLAPNVFILKELSSLVK